MTEESEHTEALGIALYYCFCVLTSLSVSFQCRKSVPSSSLALLCSKINPPLSLSTFHGASTSLNEIDFVGTQAFGRQDGDMQYFFG
ncbi:uncharacterized protein G2W53_031267 [Senna tora]|uniref:Uncharacterized protein n=1 Tax=Senna tora TaxID=362788 RepID=A0A834T7R1_9FABA|nr:uncharacterized protein G2W53_031267 [Senna tora]